MAKYDDAGRVIAGLIGHNPGPGIYSRLERAVEDMPSTVRVQELPGLIKRYREGVPGWEIKEVLTPDLTEGVQSIPRQDLLDAVKERSPVYTHKEVVLGGKPQHVFQPEYYVGETPSLAGDMIADFQRRPSPLGQGVSHGVARYGDYGQGGDNYGEVLLLQPNALGEQFASHWHGQSGAPGVRSAVAHARFDTHGDALRINELQSDLGIHNRKAREARNPPPQLPSESDEAYDERLAGLGFDVEPDFWGNPRVFGPRPLPFPLEDAWADILIKRMALEAARQGHRAIEIASPRAIAEKVGGNIDNYRHFYGKVVPGAIERLGRRMGGLSPDRRDPGLPFSSALSYRASELGVEAEQRMYDSLAQLGSRDAKVAYKRLISALEPDVDRPANSNEIREAADRLFETLVGSEGYSVQAASEAMPQYMMLANSHGQARAAGRVLNDRVYGAIQKEPTTPLPGKRYLMSDEMRRRILTQGIGAAVAAPMVTDDELIERLGK